MFGGFNVIERSLNGYPGHISAIIDLQLKNDISGLKEGLLQENPMLTAIFLHGSDWDEYKEIAAWGKKNNLLVGISADMLGLDGIKKAVESGFVDFVRMGAEKKEPDSAKKIGYIRSSGIKHEFVFCLKDSNLSALEEAYKRVSPCDSFVVEIKKGADPKVKNALIGMASKYKSLFLRMW